MTNSDGALGEVFDNVAEQYDSVREEYSLDLVKAAAQVGDLERGARVLEIGCGTGKLTEVLASLGFIIDAVDPGARMIEQAKKRLGSAENVTFHVGRFEETLFEDDDFDAVFCGTAFHWLDSRVSWRKAASHLKPRGLLALLTHMGVFNERSADAQAEFWSLLQTYVPAIAAWPSPLTVEALLSGARERSGNASEVWDWVMGDGRHQLANTEAADLFEDVQMTAVASEVELTADELIAYFRTTSHYFQIDPSSRRAFEEEDRRLIEARGGSVFTSSATVLMTARYKKLT